VLSNGLKRNDKMTAGFKKGWKK